MSDRWEQIRAEARRWHGEALETAGNDPSAAALLAAAEQITGIDCEALAAGHPLLDGGEAELDPAAGVIWYNGDLDPGVAAYYRAHEYAHHWLGDGAASCTAADIEPGAAEEPLPIGVFRVEGYGPHERKELAANIFAREFLLPSDRLRRWFVDEGLASTAIGARVGVTEGLVQHQLSRALAIPTAPATAIRVTSAPTAPAGSTPSSAPLDPSQVAAARVSHGPALVEAGPGTGKTATLTARVGYLLADGVPAEAILALTFSNKAAQEMRERVALVAPEAAARLWTGTFHAYGLELLRKHGTLLGLPARPTILDPVDALFHLERALTALPLEHYRNLYEPTISLRDILRAISRAKDELVGPGDYTLLAEAMRARAATDDEVVAAEKALEVAAVYRYYQAHLEQEGQLDFGDLIARAVELLRAFPAIRDEVRRSHAHILVDEYQDVNRASGLLLREVAGDGAGLWVVGDIRQAIYRWRGAAPDNMRLFDRDFPKATRHVLERNYRSQPPIVEVVAALAPRMRVTAGEPFTPWAAARPASDGRVLMEIADDSTAEGDGLARTIAQQRAMGRPFRDQAVLCRTHGELARVGKQLEEAGIPTLYLGDLFERSEIRDMLALIALAAEGDGRGLVRVGRFPEYAIPLDDIRALLALAREREVPFPRALDLAAACGEISERGRAGLARLAADLDGICYGGTAWSFLVRYLFDRVDYARRLARDDSAAGQQRRIALHQFLQFAHDYRAVDGDEEPKRAFLGHIRRLERFDEERQLRQVPDWAAGIDAVRLLTMHAAKGLEFWAVYLPGLAAGRFPANRRHQDCPPPDGMLTRPSGDEHDDEEECLFFVALSRARDLLCLSRPRTNGGRTSNPSRLLNLIASQLPAPPDGPATWPARPSSDAAPVVSVRPADPLVFELRALEIFMGCPRRYLYEIGLGLGGHRDDSAYTRFHGCVYATLHWLREERGSGRTVDTTAALVRLAEIWATRGPVAHPYEPIYRDQAMAMVARAADRAGDAGGALDRPTIDVPLAHGVVRLVPDLVEMPAPGTNTPIRLQRLRTGRRSKSEKDKPIYALYEEAGARAYPGATVEVATVYLSGGDEPAPVRLRPQTRDSRLGEYDEAIIGILVGDFPARPKDARSCPACPHYFICPAAEDA